MGTIDLPDRRVVCLLNWDAAAQAIAFTLPAASRIRDYWSGEDLGRQEGRMAPVVPAHGARLLVCTPA